MKPPQIQIEDNTKMKEKFVETKENKSPGPGIEELKSKAQMLYFEEEEKQKMKRQKMEMLMESLKYQNFKSFLPLPNHKFGNKPAFHSNENNAENSNNFLKTSGNKNGAHSSVKKKSQFTS